MFWSVDRRARMDEWTKCDCGYHVVEAENAQEAIDKIKAFNESLKNKKTNWWLANPLSCLNGSFNTRDEAKADYLARHPNMGEEKLKEFDYIAEMST